MKYPLPADLSLLPVITADPWIKIGPGRPYPVVEGACFDKEGFLLAGYRNAPWADILRIDINTGAMEVFYHDDHASLIGFAASNDGRVFCADYFGRLPVISSDGRFERDLLENETRDYIPNDLCFDNHGNIYFSDFTGTESSPTGGIYRFDKAEDYSMIHTVSDDLCTPNGVSFSPDFSILWTAETLKNSVTRIALGEDGYKHPHFSSQIVTYKNTGFPHVDSNATDASGNIYQAVMEGGRAIILDPQGIPIANVLIADRDLVNRMRTPNLAISPDKKEGFLLASGPDGAWVYRFDALDVSAPIYARM